MKRTDIIKWIFASVCLILLFGCTDKIEDNPYLNSVISIENNIVTAKYCEGFGNYITIDKDLARISGGDSTYFFKYDGQSIKLVQTTDGTGGRIIHDSILIFRSTDGNGTWKISIYERNGDSWEYRQEISSRRNGSNFGIDIDVDGDFMVIGDPDFSWPYAYEGRVYLYHKTAEGWIPEDEFNATEYASRDEFGRFVAIHNGFLIVGSDMVARMHIYKYDNSWALLRTDSIVLGALSHSGDIFMLNDSYNSQLRSFTLESDGNFNYHTINCDFDGHSVSQEGEIIELKDSLALVATGSYCYLMKFGNHEWTKKKVYSTGCGTCTYLGLAITDKYIVLGSYDWIQENSSVHFINY